MVLIVTVLTIIVKYAQRDKVGSKISAQKSTVFLRWRENISHIIAKMLHAKIIRSKTKIVQYIDKIITINT